MNHLSNFTYQYGVYTCFLLALYATLFTLETHTCIMNKMYVMCNFIFYFLMSLCFVQWIALGTLQLETLFSGQLCMGTLQLGSTLAIQW